MLEFKADTCSCIADLDSNSLIHKCTIHETFREMQRHNRTLNQAFVETDSLMKRVESIRLAKRTYFEKLISNQTLLDKFKRIFGL